MTWDADLDAEAAWSGNPSISIGTSSAASGSFTPGGSDNMAIAELGVSGYSVAAKYSAQQGEVGPGSVGGGGSSAPGEGLSLSYSVPSPEDVVVVLVGGQGAGLLTASGGGLSALTDVTYSECGAEVVASAGVFVATPGAGTFTANFSSTTYLNNSGSTLGAVAYVLAPGGPGGPGATTTTLPSTTATTLPADQVLSSGSYEGSTTVGSCGLDYAINSGNEETLPATGTSNLFVGATAGGKTMTPISWDEDLAVAASYSGLEAISIGHSNSGTGTFQTGANDAIAGVAVRGCTASETTSGQTSNGTSLSIDVPSSSRPVVILLGGEGTGLLSASGKQGLETLVNATFSEYGSDVIASTAIFVLPASPSPTTITLSSTTFATNSGTSLGAVAYALTPA